MRRATAYVRGYNTHGVIFYVGELEVKRTEYCTAEAAFKAIVDWCKEA